MFSGWHFSFPSLVLFLLQDCWVEVCGVIILVAFFSPLLFTFCPLRLPQCLPDELLTRICRMTAEELLHISSFSLILKLVLLLYLNPYCTYVVISCTRSELAVRLWSCKCSKSSVSLPRKQEKADKVLQLVLCFLLVPDCLGIAVDFFGFVSNGQQCQCFLCAPSLGSTAGNRTSLPVSRQVNCFLIL